MKPWLVRGVAMAALLVLVRCVLGSGITVHPTAGTPLRFAAVAAVVAVAIIAGGFDGMTDARRYADADRGVDLTGRWFKAALFAGVVGGGVSWILGTWLLPGIGQDSLWFELVVGACFTTLLVVIPAALGTLLGRRLAGRRTITSA